MPGLFLTRMAIADLKDIGRHTQKKWGREQRDKYLTTLDTCFRKLAETPLLGKDCGNIRQGYRKMNSGSHVIFYRQVSANAIEIVRVLHKRMDIDTRLTSRADGDK